MDRKMNPSAQRAKEKAAKDRRRVKAYERIAFAAFMILAYLSGYFTKDHDMTLPAPYVQVIANTGEHVHVAFVDEAGEFRSVEDGKLIGQVIGWQYP